MAVGLIVLVILAISFFKIERVDEDVVSCIADKSVLVVSATCGHCAEQKRILGEHLEEFEILDIQEHPELFEMGIRGVPSWIVGEKVYEGLRGWEDLKELSGC